MHAGEPSPPRDAAAATPPRLFKKVIAEDAPVTRRSTALFRFGEQCNNHCPMCSNTGEASLFFHATDELLRRADFLHAAGFARVVVTGGEATIHPGFWRIIEHLHGYGMAWDTNTHGRSFSQPGFARRAVGTRLRPLGSNHGVQEGQLAFRRLAADADACDRAGLLDPSHSNGHCEGACTRSHLQPVQEGVVEDLPPATSDAEVLGRGLPPRNLFGEHRRRQTGPLRVVLSGGRATLEQAREQAECADAQHGGKGMRRRSKIHCDPHVWAAVGNRARRWSRVAVNINPGALLGARASP
jgi:hypothetical protein